MFKQRQEYYTILGEFLTKFSEMETALVSYCSIITYLTNCQQGFKEYSSYTITQRTKFISGFISEKLPNLKQDWAGINWAISQINEDRRHLVHGIGNTGFYKDTIKTSVPKKGQILEKEFSIQDIRKIIYSIDDVNTGDNGIRGEFFNKFRLHRYDLYNDSISDNTQKIIYRENGITLTKHKG